jgi:transposase InsO family protein
MATRASVGSERRTRSDPSDEPSEPNLGRPQDSRRNAQTRYEHRRDQREQVHGPSPEAAIADLVSVDFFTVPTLRFQVLYVFLVLAHDRRRILHFGVTAHPTAEWTAQQLREAFPWDTAPRYLLRDRDRIFGDAFSKQVQDMAIQEVLSAPRSPWQRAYVERVIGTIRRECLDHVIVLNEASLYRHMKSFVTYYHESRTHLSLGKDSPQSRAVQPPELGRIVAIPASRRSPSQVRTARSLKLLEPIPVRNGNKCESN